MPAPRKDSSAPVWALRSASSDTCAARSSSDRAGSSSSSRPRRTPSGRSRKSASTVGTPIAASISSRSSGVSERYPTRALQIGEQLLVGPCVEERVRFGRIDEADPHQPAVSVGILVHDLRLVDDLLVDGDDLARE